jgi:DnaJ-class molecular chaperone
MPETHVCPDCGGSGRGASFTRPKDPCRACGGTGKLPQPDSEPKESA